VSLICAILGVYYSLTSWHPMTALGWIPVDGHAYCGDAGTDLVCERCGYVEAEP